MSTPDRPGREPGTRDRHGRKPRDRPARERILAAAVRRIAREGIDGVRIARIAMDAGVSPALVHYHFATREALLAEALDYSYNYAEERRVAGGSEPARSHSERLESMLEGCLPTSPELRDDWLLWLELWHQAARDEQLRPFAGELYARMHAWFADEIAAGVTAGEFDRCDPDEVADRILALLDGVGVRTIIGDPLMSLERARRTVRAAVAHELGLGESLVSGRGGTAGQGGTGPVSGATGDESVAGTGSVAGSGGRGRARGRATLASG